jgi:DNA replication initiation complex subunit (GINS family)
MLEGRGLDERAKPPREPGIIAVRFTAAVPKIVGVDMKVYGPFAPEDVASLPRENAEALIHQRAAIKIDVEG